MREIIMFISIGDDKVLSVNMHVNDSIAERMEKSEEIKLKVLIKPVNDEKEND